MPGQPPTAQNPYPKAYETRVGPGGGGQMYVPGQGWLDANLFSPGTGLQGALSPQQEANAGYAPGSMQTSSHPYLGQTADPGSNLYDPSRTPYPTFSSPATTKPKAATPAANKPTSLSAAQLAASANWASNFTSPQSNNSYAQRAQSEAAARAFANGYTGLAGGVKPIPPNSTVYAGPKNAPPPKVNVPTSTTTPKVNVPTSTTAPVTPTAGQQALADQRAGEINPYVQTDPQLFGQTNQGTGKVQEYTPNPPRFTQGPNVGKPLPGWVEVSKGVFTYRPDIGTSPLVTAAEGLGGLIAKGWENRAGNQPYGPGYLPPSQNPLTPTNRPDVVGAVPPSGSPAAANKPAALTSQQQHVQDLLGPQQGTGSGNNPSQQAQSAAAARYGNQATLPKPGLDANGQPAAPRNVVTVKMEDGSTITYDVNAELANAGRYTAAALFSGPGTADNPGQYMGVSNFIPNPSQRPNLMTPALAEQMPYKSAGFKTQEEFMTAIGYVLQADINGNPIWVRMDGPKKGGGVGGGQRGYTYPGGYGGGYYNGYGRAAQSYMYGNGGGGSGGADGYLMRWNIRAE